MGTTNSATLKDVSRHLAFLLVISVVSSVNVTLYSIGYSIGLTLDILLTSDSSSSLMSHFSFLFAYLIESSGLGENIFACLISLFDKIVRSGNIGIDFSGLIEIITCFNF